MSGVICAVTGVQIGQADSNRDNNLIVEMTGTADNNPLLVG